VSVGQVQWLQNRHSDRVFECGLRVVLLMYSMLTYGAKRGKKNISNLKRVLQREFRNGAGGVPGIKIERWEARIGRKNYSGRGVEDAPRTRGIAGTEEKN